MAFATTSIYLFDADLEVGATFDVGLDEPYAFVKRMEEVEFYEDDGSLVSLDWQKFQARYPTLSHQATEALINGLEHDPELQQVVYEAEIDEQEIRRWEQQEQAGRDRHLDRF